MEEEINDSRRLLKGNVYDKIVSILEKTKDHAVKLDNVYVQTYTGEYKYEIITSAVLRNGKIVLKNKDGMELMLYDIVYGEEWWILAGIFMELKY